MTPASVSALNGIRRAELQLTASADNVTRAFLADQKAAEVQGDKIVLSQRGIDLAHEAVAMSTAKAQLKASVKVAQTDSEVHRSLLDLLG